MPAIRELPLAASLLVIGVALFFGGGASSGSLPWLGARAPDRAARPPRDARRPRRLAGGRAARAPRPLARADRSPGPRCPHAPGSTRTARCSTRSSPRSGSGSLRRRRELALGLMALLGAVVVWSLLGKVVPPLYDDYGPRRAAPRTGRPLEPARPARRLRARARALAQAARGDAPRLRLARRARAHLLARRARDGRLRRRRVARARRTSGSRARRPWSQRRCRPPSWSGSPSCCPASRTTARRRRRAGATG